MGSWMNGWMDGYIEVIGSKRLLELIVSKKKIDDDAIRQIPLMPDTSSIDKHQKNDNHNFVSIKSKNSENYDDDDDEKQYEVYYNNQCIKATLSKHLALNFKMPNKKYPSEAKYQQKHYAQRSQLDSGHLVALNKQPIIEKHVHFNSRSILHRFTRRNNATIFTKVTIAEAVI
uniref:Uncharacterized protein n=1 Tax=Syphacia muris TaxID=451379 RepID=A0A0N5AWF1_9BILA